MAVSALEETRREFKRRAGGCEGGAGAAGVGGHGGGARGDSGDCAVAPGRGNATMEHGAWSTGWLRRWWWRTVGGGADVDARGEPHVVGPHGQTLQRVSRGQLDRAVRGGNGGADHLARDACPASAREG